MCIAASVQSTPTISTTDANGDTDSSDFFNDLNAEQADQLNLRYLQDSSRVISMPNKHSAVEPVSGAATLQFHREFPLRDSLARTATIMFSWRRNRLSDKTFETLLLLKINQDIW